MYLLCRKECEQAIPAAPLAKMLTTLGNFTGLTSCFSFTRNTRMQSEVRHVS